MTGANWSMAPSGSTHFGPDSKSYAACWYKKEGEVWFFKKAKHPSKTWYPMSKPPSKFRFGKMEKRSTGEAK